MAKKHFNFLFEGYTSSGSHIGPTPIQKYAETMAEAKKMAKKTFYESKHAFKVTRSEYKKK